MKVRNHGSKRRWLALQLAAVVGLGYTGVANADEYDDYFGTAPVNSNVAQTAGQYGDPCPPNPCPPGMPIEYGAMQPTPLGSADVGSADAGTGDIGSGVAPNQSDLSIPQDDISNFSSLANTTPAQSTGFASNASGAPEMPSMLGDFFGGSSLVLGGGGGFTGPQTIAVAGGDRRFKIPENVSPIPQDRVFFTYNHFSNAVTDATGVSSDVDRILFGFEKTFLNGNASFEFRLPFSSALDATQRAASGGESVEFGNLALTLKANMLSTSTCVISAGTALTLPTGSDYELINAGGTRDLLVENESFQLAPFVGFAQQLNRDWFTQGFIQANFDLNGFGVLDSTGARSTIQDQNLLFLSSSLGRWLYRQDTASGRIHKGVAAITELHYTTGMNDPDSILNAAGALSGVDFNALNLSSALHFQHGPTAVRLGGAAPLRTDDKLFDAEFFIQINRAF